MAKYNRPSSTGSRVRGQSPIRATSDRPDTRTHEGGAGWTRDSRSELFLTAVSTMAEDTFYESSEDRRRRVAALTAQVVKDYDRDPQWLVKFVDWLRRSANLRSVAVMVACEAVNAGIARGDMDHSAFGVGPARAVIDAACDRPDEPGEVVAYWHAHHGRNLPMALKRGVADAATRLYNERALLKYDSDSSAVRFGDVVELTHPKPSAPWQSALFYHAVQRRHGDTSEPGVMEQLPTVSARYGMQAFSPQTRRDMILNPAEHNHIADEAALTWEVVGGMGVTLDAEVWQALIPKMGYMALLRNLRNFDQAGVSDNQAQQVIARLADPEAVARSRQLPMRFLSAYRTAGLRWSYAIEQALNASLANVPSLDGRTLVLVDRSGSMFSGRISAKSGLTFADAAAIFGSALALRAEAADLVQFGTDSKTVPYTKGDDLLRVSERFDGMGGTNTAEAVRRHYRAHDRVVLVTDEQAFVGWMGSDPTSQVPATTPVHTYNLVGYRGGHGPSGPNRFTYGGLSDASFRLIPLVEAGAQAAWPWE